MSSPLLDAMRRFRRSEAAPLIAAEPVDSGAASLAAILTALGRPIPVREVTARSVATMGGPLITLVQTGRAFGLDIVALDADLDALRDLPLPAILQFHDQFVVLEGSRRGRWSVLDPVARRRRLLTDDELRDKSTGSVLAVTRGPQFVGDASDAGRSHGTRVLLAQAVSAPGFGRTMAGIVAVSVLMLAIGLTGPLLTQVLIDQVLPQRLPGIVPLIAVGLALLTLTTFVASVLRGALLVVVSGQLDNRLMTSLFGHVLALPYGFFQQHSTGDLVQRFSSNTAIRNALTTRTTGAVVDVLLVVVYGLALLWISPVFGLWALGLGLLEVATLVLPARRINRLTHRELEEVGRTQTFTVEVVTGAAYLKASGVEHGMLRSWALRLHDQLEASMRRRQFLSLISAMSTTLASSAATVLLLVGVTQVLDGSLTLGTALALITLSTSFLTPLSRLISALQQLQTVQGHVERISEVLGEPAEQADAVRAPIDVVSGRIELRGVAFRYREDGPWALRGIDIAIEPGQRVAVVGASGSGKSTLARVVLGLHRPDEGDVLVDGQDLHAHDLGSFRRQCGVVLQEPVIFNGTVWENVAFYDDSVTDADVTRALELACLRDDVAAMPDGVHTVVDERGTALSGGQRQRLALARALVRRPRVLVLDEATGALDNVTEAAVNAALRAERATTLIIAHRLSTVREADHIVVLERGSIVDAGTHAELMGRGGPYAALVHADEASESLA